MPKTFKFMQDPDSREWIGIVINTATNVVVTCATEPSREAIIEWWRVYVESGGTIETDAYDRAKKRPN